MSMYTPKPVPTPANRGGSESMSSSIAYPTPQGKSSQGSPGMSINKCEAINAGTGTKGSTGTVNSVPPRCC